jgi:hypothetical protein
VTAPSLESYETVDNRLVIRDLSEARAYVMSDTWVEWGES